MVLMASHVQVAVHLRVMHTSDSDKSCDGPWPALVAKSMFNQSIDEHVRQASEDALSLAASSSINCSMHVLYHLRGSIAIHVAGNQSI